MDTQNRGHRVDVHALKEQLGDVLPSEMFLADSTTQTETNQTPAFVAPPAFPASPVSSTGALRQNPLPPLPFLPRTHAPREATMANDDNCDSDDETEVIESTISRLHHLVQSRKAPI